MGRGNDAKADDVVFQAPDHYGQIHPVEDDSLIARKLSEFDAAVDQIVPANKQRLLQAQQRCPHLLTADFKLWFLRCEVYVVAKAAKRYVAYWNKRVEIFGEERAFLPLTLASMDASDRKACAMGVYNVYEASNGRIVAFEALHRYSLEGTSRESLLRAFWYFVHCALENEETQKRGIVVLNYPGKVNIRKQQDFRMVRMIASVRGALPLRLSAYHIVHPPSWVSMFLPLLSLLLGERLRKRILIHVGSKEKVIERLSGYGLNRMDIPKEIDGDRIVDTTAFLDRRESAGL